MISLRGSRLDLPSLLNKLLTDDPLRKLGLRENPFTYPIAENDPHLSEYYVRPGSARLPELAEDVQPRLIFAKTGYGKDSTQVHDRGTMLSQR